MIPGYIREWYPGTYVDYYTDTYASVTRVHTRMVPGYIPRVLPDISEWYPGTYLECYPDTYPSGTPVHTRVLSGYMYEWYPSTYTSTSKTSRCGTWVPQKHARYLVYKHPMILDTPLQYFNTSTFRVSCVRVWVGKTKKKRKRQRPNRQNHVTTANWLVYKEKKHQN